ncbi:MAG: Competence protein F homolog, phosphoribosyltransferase domain; protein YhgH required for utilization of DNA as sole source of carbon and energy, partial [uncultured Blastococcus sp.]
WAGPGSPRWPTWSSPARAPAAEFPASCSARSAPSCWPTRGRRRPAACRGVSHRPRRRVRTPAGCALRCSSSRSAGGPSWPV